MNNYGGTLSYKHNFAKPNKDITADVNYNYSKNSNHRMLPHNIIMRIIRQKARIGQQRTIGDGTTKYFTAQTDYTNPITDKMKLEAGLRGAIRNYNS